MNSLITTPNGANNDEILKEMDYKNITLEDLDHLKKLQPEGWSDITLAFQFYCSHDFCFPIKIMVDGKIAGIGNSIIFEDTAWLAHIIVKSEYRNQGIGSKVAQTLLEGIKKKGVKTSLLVATDLGKPVYLKAGFREVSDYCYFKMECSFRDNIASKNIEPYKSDFYNEVIHLDSFISGENREKLLKKYLNSAFVFLHNKRIDGFFIPGLGEGPVIALTVNAGRALMRFKNAASPVDKVTIPKENITGIGFLREWGFIETETTGTRMVLGNDIPWKPEMVYSRIGGNLG